MGFFVALRYRTCRVDTDSGSRSHVLCDIYKDYNYSKTVQVLLNEEGPNCSHWYILLSNLQRYIHSLWSKQNSYKKTEENMKQDYDELVQLPRPEYFNSFLLDNLKCRMNDFYNSAKDESAHRMATNYGLFERKWVIGLLQVPGFTLAILACRYNCRHWRKSDKGVRYDVVRVLTHLCLIYLNVQTA